MDREREAPDKTRIRGLTPNFALYGHPAEAAGVDFVQCERIPVRSAPHGWTIAPHVHAALLQALLLTQGGGEVFVDGRIWTLVAPCLIFIPARAVHGFRFTPDTDGPVVTAAQTPLEHLTMSIAPELVEALREPAVLALEAGSREGARVRDLMRVIEAETAEPAPWRSAASLSLTLALTVEIARLGRSARGRDTPQTSRIAAQGERFRALIERHFRARRPVGAYAKDMGVSPGQLTRISHAALGVSALQAIDQRTLHEAKRLIVYSTLSIKQIAGELGFRDEAYFGRVFRKQTGCAPTEFRATALTPVEPISTCR